MSMLASLLSSGIQKDWSQQDKKKPCDKLCVGYVVSLSF